MSEDGPRAALITRTLAGERSAIAAALNLLDDQRPEARRDASALLAALPPTRVRSEGQLIGVTGPPGAGKSSLVAALIEAWRGQGRSVGVLAVDPSSPVSGGALLGDRLRMLQPEPDDGLFIRSLAGRGEVGGLGATVYPMAQVMLCAFDIVVVETIGVGQSEVDVAFATDTTCLVAQPASGDMIQYLKAGIMELPHVVAVNKADLGPIARRAADELATALPPGPDDARWTPVVLLVSATERTRIDDLVQALDDHHRFTRERGALESARRAQLASWGLKRLRVEFGEFGVERLGGANTIRNRFADAASPFAILDDLRGLLLAQLSGTPVLSQRRKPQR